MMEANNNNNCVQNESDDDEPILNPHIRVPPMPENPRGYPPFDMHLVPNYTNNQITYYYTTGAIPASDQARFHQLMKQCKTSLNLISWDGTLDGGNNSSKNDETNDPDTLDDCSLGSDSDCPTLLPNYKGIKISPLDISKL